MNSIATAISNGRTDTSFVDDLNALRGTVNSRVALLLRSIEVHPLQLRCVFSRTHPSTFPFSGTIAHAGVFEIAVGARVPKSQTHAYAQTVRHESQMNETAEGCAPRWSRVFSRHHRSSLEIPSPRPFFPSFFPSFPRSSSLPPVLSFPPSWHSRARGCF